MDRTGLPLRLVATGFLALLCGAAHASDGLAACRTLSLQACPDPLDATLPAAHDMLTWDVDARVIGFRNNWRMYRGDAFHAAGTPSSLPRAPEPMPAVRYTSGHQPHDLVDYLERQRARGLLLIKDGRIAYEFYGHGNTERTLWTSRSVAKSVVSVLVGIAVAEGSIHSVQDPITRYLPELRHTAWDGVSLHQLMTHTSGTQWNENYADPNSDFARMTYCEARPDPYPCILHLVRNLPRRQDVQPGEVWSYNTAGAWLVGRILERATGMTIARYLETRLWSREPMERDGVWHALDPGHVDMGGHGFNATLRDWGRFALFVERGGRLADGTRLLPEDWVRRSTTWTHAKGSVTPDAPDGQYGYQWWYAGLRPELGDQDGALTVARRSFWAEGIYGQAIAIDPVEHVVMVQWSTWPDAAPGEETYEEQVLFFAAVVNALHR
jgi:CubicO group peptidase (beta-lactamase class C family)